MIIDSVVHAIGGATIMVYSFRARRRESWKPWWAAWFAVGSAYLVAGAAGLISS